MPIVVDCLRGFALFGLFIIHMVEYFELYWYLPEPGFFHNLIFFLFGGKAYAIFALLFGLSFFIIMDNQAKRGVDFRARFSWRLTLPQGHPGVAEIYANGSFIAADLYGHMGASGVRTIPDSTIQLPWQIVLQIEVCSTSPLLHGQWRVNERFRCLHRTSNTSLISIHC